MTKFEKDNLDSNKKRKLLILLILRVFVLYHREITVNEVKN